MKVHIDDYIPSEATHVGEYIFDEMEARGMTQKELAETIGISPSFLNEIIKGKRSMNAEIAVNLEKIWGTKAYVWMNLQAQYEIDIIRIKYRDIPALV